MMILFGILAVVSALGIVLARWLGAIARPKVCLAVSVPVFFISFSLLLVTMPDGNWSSLGVMCGVSAVTTLMLLSISVRRLAKK